MENMNNFEVVQNLNETFSKATKANYKVEFAESQS